MTGLPALSLRLLRFRVAAMVWTFMLLGAAWPDGAIVHDNTLDQFVARLRRKLRELAAECSIDTVHGVGYRLT